jgi:hypothetical protein
MSGYMKLLLAATLLVFIINIPFGFWRARVRRFSPQWLLAVHIPIPLVITCRYLFGLGWHLITFPMFFGAFFAGQFVGGKLRQTFNGL